MVRRHFLYGLVYCRPLANSIVMNIGFLELNSSASLSTAHSRISISAAGALSWLLGSGVVVAKLGGSLDLVAFVADTDTRLVV